MTKYFYLYHIKPRSLNDKWLAEHLEGNCITNIKRYDKCKCLGRNITIYILYIYINSESVHVATGLLELKTLIPFCIEDRAYLVRRAPVVCFSPHKSLDDEKRKKHYKYWLAKEITCAMSTGHICLPLFNIKVKVIDVAISLAFIKGYDNLLKEWHQLYVWRDVLFCPFLSECEEMVESLQRVLWEVFHPQQADGLWTRGAVHQGDALEESEFGQCRDYFLKRTQE